MRIATPIAIAAMTALGLAALAGCKGPREINTAGIEPIPVSTLETDGAKIGERIKKGERLVFLLKEGEKLPLKLTAAMPFLEIETAGQEVVFTRDTYFIISPDGMFVSPDGELWAAVHDTDALKELYGAKQGFLSIGLSATEEEGASVAVSVGLQ